MNLVRVKDILEIAFSAKLPLNLYGPDGIGKSSFIRQTFPKTKVLHDSELNGNLEYLHAVIKSESVLLFEHISDETLQKVLRIVQNRTIFTEPFNNMLIFTSLAPLAKLKGFIQVEFPKPTIHEWVQWAERHAVHPLVIKVAQELQLLQKYRPLDLENLSKILNCSVPADLLDTLIVSVVGNDIDLIAKIKEGYDNSISFDKMIALEDDNFIERLKQTSSENIDKFNQNLIDEIKFDESIISKEKLLSYISTIDSTKTLSLLGGLIASEKSYGYLNELLQEPYIQKKIDELLTL